MRSKKIHEDARSKDWLIETGNLFHLGRNREQKRNTKSEETLFERERIKLKRERIKLEKEREEEED